MLTRKKVIKVALETTKGTKVSGSQDLLVYDLEIKPTAPFIERKGTGKYLGQTVTGVIGERSGQCSFKTELRDEGLSALDAGLTILIQACGFKKTVEVYNLCSNVSDMKTVSLDVWEDGVKKSIYGAMGHVTFEGETGKQIFLNFEFFGIWNTPTDDALPGYLPSAVLPAILKAGTFTVGGIAMQTSRISLNLNSTIAPRFDVNAASGILHYQITDYDPQFTFDPECVTVAAYDHFGKWIAGIPAAVVLSVMGNAVIRIDIPVLQYKEVGGGDREGMIIYNITGQCLHSSGDDAVSLRVM